MIICPKLGDHNLVLDENIIRYITHTYEIHMTNPNLQMSWAKCKEVISEVSKIRKTREVILHMPFLAHTFEFYMMSKEYYDQLIKMLIDCIRYSDKTGIKIGLLFHCDFEIALLSKARGEEFIGYLISLVEDSGVYFLCENTIPDVNRYDPKYIASFELLTRINHPKLVGCLDTCHLKTAENILQTKLVIQPCVARQIHEIHFSATLDGDGFRDKRKTHGKVHNSLVDLENDLLSVLSLGRLGLNLDDLVFVVEVSELDYVRMPDMRKEIDKLNNVYTQLKERNKIISIKD